MTIQMLSFRKRMLAGLHAFLVLAATLIGFYALCALVGFACFVLMFKAGLLGTIGILFFRGLLVALFAGIATFGLFLAAVTRWQGHGLQARDVFGGVALSLAFNTCFLVVVPVTVDRSISVFILGTMAGDPQRTFTAAEMSDLFTKVYVGDDRQIERRMHEQAVTGNVEQSGTLYRISTRGRLFIETAKLAVWLFGGDTRFVSPVVRPKRDDIAAVP